MTGPATSADLGRDPDWVRRTDHALRPDPERVVATLFLPGQEAGGSGRSRSALVLERVLALTDEEVGHELRELTTDFDQRHLDLEATWEAHFELVRHRLPGSGRLSQHRRRLVGAYFTAEYAIEGAALFNPSIAPHPDQSGLPHGTTRFVMTVRAVGEGHRSSVELRTGTIDAADVVTMDPAPRLAQRAVVREPTYSRMAFEHRLDGVDPDRGSDDFVLEALPAFFGRRDLDDAFHELSIQRLTRGSASGTIERFERIAACTYEVEFPPASPLQERVLMPHGPSESQGMEDVRLVRFLRPDEPPEYLGTYTAFDGRDISTQLLRTRDFTTFVSEPVSGPGSLNKGLALFPRKVGGRYLALSRADRESNAVTASRDLLLWDEPVVVQRPARSWELIQLGNCGPPIETEAGWLVLTHGVGAMRSYSIGAILLDLEEPTRVLGSLAHPLLTAAPHERSGYVPNVVYSCGAMLHGRTLVLPYGSSDVATRIALVDLDALLAALGARVDRQRESLIDGQLTFTNT